MALSDCERVAEIRVRGWQQAYAGMMPQPYLDGLDVADEIPRRRAHFEQPGEGVVNLVAELDGDVVGWACHGPYRDGELATKDAELYAIYVHPDHLAQGVGQALLRESTTRCAAAGHARMLLWVLKENTRARRFYEQAGFTPDGTEESWDVAGAAVPEVRYVRRLGGAPSGAQGCGTCGSAP
ncbi:GNAT family N-acetyltransferase [Streptomyces sp. HC44]|uniref:GNAT family N-acetyltransferase n=1 Tax=Streptomyces scabichelini TaxID=2711217 RepID=A0A6G4VBE0_9ACTN|nr:GNAT family N-acetyltransferase [Streptomyces scabichelini]NGO11123.1 GNAT family N-acetyltransferase [Streptomyces scabichelini]